MNIDTLRESLNTNKYLGCEKKKFFVEGEINVPDIKPDIGSVISVKGSVYITSKEILENKVKIDGTFDAYVIYLSDDDEMKIRGLNNSISFTEYIDFPNITDDSILKVKLDYGNVESKVLNSRKLNIKCPVSINVCAIKKETVEITSDVSESSNVEKQLKNVSFQTLYDYKCENTLVNETINLNENNEPIGEILDVSISIGNKDYKTSYNKILAKAEANIKIIYIADNEKNSIESFETQIPVMSFIDVDGLNENMKITLNFGISNVSIKSVYQDMKANAIAVSMNVLTCAAIQQNISFNIINDLYSLDKNVICGYGNASVLKNNFDVSIPIELSQNLLIPELENIRILNIDANPVITELNILDGKLAIEGKAEFDILYYRNDKNILETKKMELPFQQVLKIPELKNDMIVEIDINVESLEYKTSGTNEIRIDIVLLANVKSDDSMNIMYVNNVSVSDEKLNEVPSIIVYFVKKDDTLWKIAKRFHTTVDDIKEINELTDDLIYPGEHLIIRKRTIQNNAIKMM